MSAKTRIIVIRKGQLLFAGIALLIVLALCGLLFAAMHAGEDNTEDTEAAMKYTPGVYTSTVVLNDTALDVRVVVDEDHINSISMVNLDETVETMYPLVRPALEELSEQIISIQSIGDVTFPASNQYTSMVLYDAICEALEKAASS